MAAICVTGNSITLTGFQFDGNGRNTAQDISGIIDAGQDFSINGVQIAAVHGSVYYGAGLRFQNATNAIAANIVAQQNGGDGVNIFGSSTNIAITNLRASNNGILGLDIENYGAARPSFLTITNFQGVANAGSDLLVKDADDVTINGITITAGSSGLSENNGALKVRGSNRVTIGGTCTITGPGSGSNPHGIWLDDEGTTDHNSTITVSSCVLNGWAGDGIRFDRPGSVGGSSNVTLENVSSANNHGYGAHVTVPNIVTNLSAPDSSFTGNAAGATSPAPFP